MMYSDETNTKSLEEEKKMTTFEFYKSLFDKATGANGGRVYFKLKDQTYKTVKQAMDECFGAAYSFELRNAGVDLKEVEMLVEQKVLKHKHYDNWKDRQKGTTDLYSLTAKGIKQWYGMFF